MRKTIIIASVLFVGVAVLGWSQLGNNTVFAQSFRSGDKITVGASETVNSTLFAAGKTVDIKSDVFGDVFCAGQTVTITGRIHGDVICTGQSVNVFGQVDGDVRLAGQTVTLGDAILGNATIASQTFNFSATSSLNGDLTLAAQTSNIDGNIGRDIAVNGEDVVISGKVGRNLIGHVENLSLQTGGRVVGNIDFTSRNELSKAAGATVGGTVTRSQPTVKESSGSHSFFEFAAVWYGYWFIAMLVLSMLLALLLPRTLHTVTKEVVPLPWKALLTGFLASLAIPVILLLLAVTVIGLPAAFVLGTIWLAVGLLALPVAGYWVGRLLLKRSPKPLVIMLLGIVVLMLLLAIPFVNFFIFLAAFWIGTGALLQSAYRRIPKPVYNFEQKPAKKK